ncbi:aminopeptidase P family N-terminal domain-containing protein [Lactobacillus sp. ESL0791]|uniref:M24 family metallopeptidase n=1 Tax=Lactobacillus sp. ESL0791 TaxID=2983234 RepID=UPI0023F8B4F2|nr:aminopeptidase P family N-terminal domain-containing protein [Lactobacillus sp. ESL0791]MDF7639390.1 aminopeptidase P family N-terminal domain-containing protein [Lactobacillus sp. ESL0791]
MKINLTQIPMPKLTEDAVPVKLTEETMTQRKEKLLQQMKKRNLDTVVIYADREHGANFEYFTGFVPRFEEAMLVIHKTGKAFLLLGNENTKMVEHARIQAELIHVPFFSLPNQPMKDEAPLENVFRQAQIETTARIALIGWKNFTSTCEDNTHLYDVPYYLVDALKKISENPANIVNGTDMLISAVSGLRTINNANEIAHYEYGATLAGIGVLRTINAVAPGKTETELANNLALDGQPNNVFTICAAGERFTDGNFYPENKAVQLGEPFSTSVGYKGGLSSRAAYVATDQTDLPASQQDYVSKLAAPYYGAVVTWLENMRIGNKANDIYDAIESAIPKKDYHWKLNPGHFVADEEWLSSPFYPGSAARIKSGQMLQVDIIPSIAGYGGTGCEDGVAIADKQLRAELADYYPTTWKRMCRRQKFIREELHIKIADEVLPLNDIVAYYRPYLLNHKMAFRKD